MPHPWEKEKILSAFIDTCGVDVASALNIIKNPEFAAALGSLNFRESAIMLYRVLGSGLKQVKVKYLSLLINPKILKIIIQNDIKEYESLGVPFPKYIKERHELLNSRLKELEEKAPPLPPEAPIKKRKIETRRIGGLEQAKLLEELIPYLPRESYYIKVSQELSIKLKALNKEDLLEIGVLSFEAKSFIKIDPKTYNRVMEENPESLEQAPASRYSLFASSSSEEEVEMRPSSPRKGKEIDTDEEIERGQVPPKDSNEDEDEDFDIGQFLA